MAGTTSMQACLLSLNQYNRATTAGKRSGMCLSFKVESSAVNVIEARIRTLTELLRHAKVGDAPASSGVVEPGTLITAMLMKHVIDVDQVKEVDYLIGEDNYKRIWMSHRRERRGIIAYNPRSLPGLAGLARERAGRLVKAARAKWQSIRQGDGASAPPPA